MTAPSSTKTRRFTVYRRGDLSETHDSNQVNPASQPQFEGVVFSDGTTVVRWLTAARSTSVWADFDTLWKIHGHADANSKNGTVIVWHDDADEADDPPMWGVELRNGRWLDELFKTKQGAERGAEDWLFAGGMAKRLDDPDGPHPLYRNTRKGGK